MHLVGFVIRNNLWKVGEKQKNEKEFQEWKRNAVGDTKNTQGEFDRHCLKIRWKQSEELGKCRI